MEDVESISAEVVDAAYQLHRGLGPGLLESVYEAILAYELTQRGLFVERQKHVPFIYNGIQFDEGFRVDILVGGVLVVELKSIEALAPVHAKQVLTYLRLLDLRVGLLVNFGAATFKDGIRRVVNNHTHTATSRLRVNRK